FLHSPHCNVMVSRISYLRSLSTCRFGLITQVQQPAHYRFRKGPDLRFFPAAVRAVITAPSAGPSAKPLFGIRERFLDLDSPNQIALRIRAHFLRTANREPEKLMALPNLQTFSVQPLRRCLHFQPPRLSPAFLLSA